MKNNQSKEIIQFMNRKNVSSCLKINPRLNIMYRCKTDNKTTNISDAYDVTIRST